MDVDRAGMSSRRESGAPAAVAVLLWILVGWPVSWLLLFFSGVLGILFGVGITVAMVVVVVRAGRARPPVPIMVAPDPRMVAIRQDVEGLAHIDAAGGCGWCGSPVAHVNDGGYPVHPRHWHAGEIDERVRERARRRR